MSAGRTGCGLHYEVRGAGPSLLLVAGLNGQGRFWSDVLDEFAGAYRVAVFDQRGCGQTPDDGADWSIETLAEDALAVAEGGFDGAPFAVVGHSTGGAIAQCMAGRWPERVRAAGLSATWSVADAYMRALFDLRLALLERAPDLDPALSDLMRTPPEQYRATAAGVALDAGVTIRRIRALLAHDGPRYLPRIACPTLVIGAEDDRIVPRHLAEALHAALPGGEYAMLADGGHFYPQSRPGAFSGYVLDWLDRVT